MSKNAQTFLLFVVSLIVFAFAVSKHWKALRAAPLGPGEVLEETSREASPLASLKKGSWYFYVIGSLEEDGDLLKFLEVLTHTPRLQTGNLVVRALIDGDDQEGAIETFARDNDITYRIGLLHDLSREETESLRLTDHKRRYFLLDPGLQVAFHSNWLQPNDLRLLFEKHFLSTSASQAFQPLEVGSRLQFDSLEPVGQTSRPLDLSSALLIVFTSKCVRCALENRLAELALNQEIVRAQAELSGRTPFLVFSPSFVSGNLGLRLEEARIDLPAYMPSDLEGIESVYYRRSLGDSDVLVLETDDQARLISVKAWDQYLPRATEPIGGDVQS